MSTHKEITTSGKNKLLMIPDYVLPGDIPAIYKYFDYFNIADVKNVQFCEFSEEEYYVEDNSPYGYAIIEIDSWRDTQSARNFYQSIVENRCKMVYDDPCYWDLEFYEALTATKSECCKNTTLNVDPESTNSQVINDNGNEPEVKQETHEESSDFDSENDIDSDEEFESDEEEQVEEEEEEFDSGSEQDNLRDLDYEYEEPDETADRIYEYYPIVKKLVYQIETRSKTRAKREKINSKAENTIKDLIIKNNKNSRNSQKTKKMGSYVWSRRLRQKVS